MTMTTPDPAQATPGSQQRRRPSWWQLLLGLVVVVALLAAAVAVFAGKGKNLRTATPPATSTVAPPTSSPSPSAGTTPPFQTAAADGCLGGVLDLDQAVLTAQRQAPITPTGAAEFTATLLRWANAAPVPRAQKSAAAQILAPDAAPGTSDQLSGSKNLGDYTSLSADFAQGRYRIDSFSAGLATVTYLYVGHSAKNGETQPDVQGAGGVVLEAVGGHWRFKDTTDPTNLSIQQVQSTSVPYLGGC